MKKLFTLLISLSLLSCYGKQPTQKIEKNSDNEGDAFKLIQKEVVQIFGRSFIVTLSEDSNSYNSISVVRDGIDTVYWDSEFSGSFEVTDFNSDGFKDIILDYLGNNSSQDLLLFNPQDTTFQSVGGFLSFPDAVPLKDTGLYYSYHRSGCADSNWDSDLFKIKDYKAEHLGNIHGVGCEKDADRNGIYIYKQFGKRKSLLEKIPIEKIAEFENNKWGFIASYWEKKYKRFTN